jgi:ASC-1-like (ASCH) protein
MIHEYKIIDTYFEKILSGKKNFEIRLADKEIKEGDELVLKEINSEKEYTGREIQKKVNYVAKTKDCNHWPQKEIEELGFQVIGFE